MEMLWILIPLSFLMALGGLCAFIWATKTGQFDDLSSPAQSIFHDDAR